MDTMEASIVEGETHQKSGFKGFLIGGGITLPFLILPTAQIALGAQYLHDCPVSPGIPLYLMACGTASLLLVALFALPKLFCPSALGSIIWSLCTLSLILFYFIWLIYGSYLIYSIYPLNYTEIILKPNRSNTSISTTAEPPIITTVLLENQNQSVSQNMTQNMSDPFFKQTGMVNTTDQTVFNLTQSVSVSNSSGEMNRDRLNAQRDHLVQVVVLYCDRTMYLFAFWTTTLLFVIILLLTMLNQLNK